jgi:hypothetical protein
MERNPYTPPEAQVRDPKGSAYGATWKAVLYGFLADIAGTTIGGMVIVGLWPSLLLPPGMSAEEGAKLAQPSDGFMLVSLLVGLGCTVLGGYVAAKVANHREYWHAFLVGLASLIFGELVLGLSQDPNPYPLAHRLIGDLLVIPAALVGAHFRLAAKARRAASA